MSSGPWRARAWSEYHRAMWKYPACAAVLASSGCYVSLGLGASSSAATAHMTAGIATTFGEHRAHIHVGGGGAVGQAGDRGVVAYPLAIGGSLGLIRSNHHALAAVVDVMPPFTGFLLESKQQPSEAAHVGRAYLGIGYQHTVTSHDHAPDAGSEPRPSGLVTFSIGPELYWVGTDHASVGVTADLTVVADGWQLQQAIFDDR